MVQPTRLRVRMALLAPVARGLEVVTSEARGRGHRGRIQKSRVSVAVAAGGFFAAQPGWRGREGDNRGGGRVGSGARGGGVESGVGRAQSLGPGPPTCGGFK